MTISKDGEHWYGTDDADIAPAIAHYSQASYPATRFMPAACPCGGEGFALDTDEEAGAARRTCSACDAVKLMGDSAEYAPEATFERHSCICGHEVFAITPGVALYADSNDVRWYYIGCRCRACDLVGVFADWKCEAGDADRFLADT